MKQKIYKEHKNALPSPDDIAREELQNGIIILSRSNFNSPTLSIKGYLLCGSLLDPDDKLGLSLMTAESLMSGTQQHDFQALFNEIESVGASLNFSSGTLTTSFSAHCLSEDLALILNLISECLRNPSFPEKEFNRLKAQLLTSLAIRSQDTASMAALQFDQIVFNGHPYRRPEEGYPETVQAITPQDLPTFYQQSYGPNGMVISIVGAVEPQQAMEAVKHAFGDWHNDAQRPLPEIPPVEPIKQSIKKNTHIPGKFQADIVMGGLAPTRSSPDFHPLRIGNNILGEFGMMGRLGNSVREKSGLAYYAYSSINMNYGPGTWEMIAGVNPKHINQAISLIRKEVKNFVASPVSQEELTDSKSFYLGHMPLTLESNSGVAVSLLNIERFGLGLDYFIRYPTLIQGVTAEDILQASQKYLVPECLAISIAEP